jgi:hypothetical protein
MISCLAVLASCGGGGGSASPTPVGPGDSGAGSGSATALVVAVKPDLTFRTWTIRFKPSSTATRSLTALAMS